MKEIIEELKAIFPQHVENTINYIFNDVVRIVGEENQVLILPSCIERLLELPGDFVAPVDNLLTAGVNRLQEINNEFVAKRSETKNNVKEDNILNLSDNSDLSSNNSDDTSGFSNHDEYRNREGSILLWRDEERHYSDLSLSSHSEHSEPDGFVPHKLPELSLHNELPDLFSNSNDEMFLLEVLEDKSTKPELIKHDIYDKGDDVIIFNDKNENSSFLQRKRRLSRSNEMGVQKINKTDVNEFINSIKHDVVKVENQLHTFRKKYLGNDIPMPSSIFLPRRSSSSSTLSHAPTSSSATSKSVSGQSSLITTPTSSGNTATLLSSSNTAMLPSLSSTIASSSATTVNNIDVSTLRKGSYGYMPEAKKQVMAVIEDVCPKYLEKLIHQQPHTFSIAELVNLLVVYLLDNKDYDKVNKRKPSVQTQQETATPTLNRSLYNRQSIITLQNKFPQIATKQIRSVMTSCKFNYSDACKMLEDALEQIQSHGKCVSETMIRSFMKRHRKPIKLSKLEPSLAAELREYDDNWKTAVEKGDRDAAIALNSKQYEEEGQAIECGCCYGDAAFEDMVQCIEGHLFCTECLQRYSKEAVFGSGKVQLFCMTDGCDSTFPISQLKKALPENILNKYFERVQDEDLKLANIDNLIKCPHCEFAAEMADGDKVFRCQNSTCLKQTCRYCKEDWTDHFGLPCAEVENRTETTHRTLYEEKMTEAKVRKCWQCQTIFLKSDGCNKMTCRCGAKMCYICREPKIDYNHFCQHLREPGKGCNKCKSCSLWTDPTEDDDRAVAEIKKQAEIESNLLSAENEKEAKSIGPKMEVKVVPPPEKKHRYRNHHNNRHRHHPPAADYGHNHARYDDPRRHQFNVGPPNQEAQQYEQYFGRALLAQNILVPRPPRFREFPPLIRNNYGRDNEDLFPPEEYVYQDEAN